jgi:S1-C subfamily serine protease
MPEQLGRSGQAEAGGEKDFWEKIQAIAGFATGLLVAVIGGLFTYVYNERQRSAQEAQSRRQLAIDQVQTIRAFHPHLSSSDPREKEFAIIAISALGNARLAVRLADTYRDEGSVSALERIATTGNGQAAQAARRSLRDILATMRRAVVEVDYEFSKTSGFVASTGMVATVGSEVRAGHPVTLTYMDGETEQAKVLRGSQDFDVVLVQARPSSRPVLPIKGRGDIAPGTKVAALGHGATDWLQSTGTIRGVTRVDGTRLLVADIQTERGVAGAPVVSRTGEVVALGWGRDRRGALLLPASAVGRAARSLEPP